MISFSFLPYLFLANWMMSSTTFIVSMGTSLKRVWNWSEISLLSREKIFSIFDSSTGSPAFFWNRSEEHTSELQSRFDIVCRLLLQKQKENRVKDTLDTPLFKARMATS